MAFNKAMQARRAQEVITASDSPLGSSVDGFTPVAKLAIPSIPPSINEGCFLPHPYHRWAADCQYAFVFSCLEGNHYPSDPTWVPFVLEGIIDSTLSPERKQYCLVFFLKCLSELLLALSWDNEDSDLENEANTAQNPESPAYQIRASLYNSLSPHLIHRGNEYIYVRSETGSISKSKAEEDDVMALIFESLALYLSGFISSASQA